MLQKKKQPPVSLRGAGGCFVGKEEEGAQEGSDGEDFFLLGGEDGVYLFEEAVVELLRRGFGVFLDVFGHAFFDGFLEAVDGVAAGVAD